MEPPLLVVVGPTASGKTDLSLRLAHHFGGEVIGADSVQLYRHFDIGSGKPSPRELGQAPHHLIDCVDPLLPLDAASWAERAAALVSDMRARDRQPIVCGGTFLWIKALLYGLAPAPPADEGIRERHRQIAESAGREALHRELARVDPSSAARLSPNDYVRVSRALEVHELSGVTLTEWHRQHGFRQQRQRAVLVGVNRTREELDQRIATRTRAMLAAGWVEEVRSLMERGYEGARAMKSVGYRQISEALREGAGHVAEQEIFDSVYRATRVFARRQRTWLRDQPVRWLDPQPSVETLTPLLEGAQSPTLTA